MPLFRRPSEPAPEPSLGTLYVVANAHLDTQWRWTVRDTIRDFLPRTLAANFRQFRRSKHYALSFEGAFRYMLVREYDPAGFEEIKRWVHAGRWHPAGSMLDAPDANIPSPESLIRHVLLGNGFFERHLGRHSLELFLPDGFGFPWSLPSVAAQCGLTGFCSQKFIKWMAPAAIPFDLGVWRGPDGGSVVAALNPDGYGDPLHEDLARARRWEERIGRLAGDGQPGLGYKLFGPRGDQGGAADDESVARLEEALARPRRFRIVTGSSDRLFREIGAERIATLPHYSGELLLPTHGTGCLTSQTVLKRWDRRNEQLALAAERAALAASLLGAMPWPRRTLRDSWIRFLWHQMHDDITGTSVPQAYTLSWNDEIVAMNRFAGVLTDAVAAVARALDTRAHGVPLVVFNPLGRPRTGVVDATVRLSEEARAVRVTGPDGEDLVAQVVRREGPLVGVLFRARLPGLGFAVFDVTPTDAPPVAGNGLGGDERSLSNQALEATLGPGGDLVGLSMRGEGRETLASPARLLLLPDRSRRWPAWEILFEDLQARPREVVGGGATIRVIEDGPVRRTLEVERRAAGSRFVQRYRLAAGGDCLEMETTIDWRSRQRLLKLELPLALSNPEATFDLGLGVIRRGNASRRKYEVPAQQWADLTALDRSWGLSILTDRTCGWDKPDDHTLRLTLLRSPRARAKFAHQATQDFGRHRSLLALYPHAGEWATAETPARAAELNQPLRAFRVEPSAGPLGRSFSLLEIDVPGVELAAAKRSESGHEIVLRLRETHGHAARVALAPCARIRSARELDADEGQRGELPMPGGRLGLDLGRFAQRTIAVRCETVPERVDPPRCRRLRIPRDVVAVTWNEGPERGDFDGRGGSYPGELLTEEIDSRGVTFDLAPLAPGSASALACSGQVLALPAAPGSAVELLAASSRGDATGVFEVGGQRFERIIHDWAAEVGRWDRWTPSGRLIPWKSRVPGRVVRTPIAWVGTHRHDRRQGDLPYEFCYLFRYRIELPPGATRLRLPREPRIKLFAATLVENGSRAEAAQDLFGEPEL